tara:strand:+ start:815 stop:1090 length:276 start_codon:yes stop_codon:yes gene_type:complete
VVVVVAGDPSFSSSSVLSLSLSLFRFGLPVRGGVYYDSTLIFFSLSSLFLLSIMVVVRFFFVFFFENGKRICKKCHKISTSARVYAHALHT